MKESVLRTLVPVIYALLINKGIASWLGIDDDTSRYIATTVATGLVYVALRVAERYKTQVGWLLGYPAEPQYQVAPKGHGEAGHGHNYLVIAIAVMVLLVLLITAGVIKV